MGTSPVVIADIEREGGHRETPEGGREKYVKESVVIQGGRGNIRVAREGWVHKEVDEKATVKSDVISGEADGERFEHSVHAIKAETPLGEIESEVKRTTVRVEREEDVDEDSVRRIRMELTRIEEAFRTKPKDEETAIKQYLTAVNPILEILEKQPEENETKKVITVIDRGEHEWLKNTEYVLTTEKRWVDEEGVEHHKQCTQAIGYERAENPETEADKPWGRAVTHKFSYGAKKEQKMTLETNTIEFNPEVTINGGEEKQEDEDKSLIESSVGGFEVNEEGTGQQTVLTFYRDEESEEPENAHIDYVVYEVVHEPPADEENTATTVETIQEANESANEVEELERTSDGVNDLVKNAESINVVESYASQSEQVEEDSKPVTHLSGEVEEESGVESVEQSSESSKEEFSEDKGFEGQSEARNFIVVEAGPHKWILPLGRVLEKLGEGLRKCDEDEERYCEELKKSGAPQWIFPWLLRQMLYERRIPEEVLRAALKYLEKDTDIEERCEGYIKAVESIEKRAGEAVLEEELKNADSAEDLDKRVEFFVLPSGRIVSLSKEWDDFSEIVSVINELLDFKWFIESAESEYYIATLPDGKRYRVGPVERFVVLEDGRRIAVMLPEPAVMVWKAFPDLRERLRKVVENLFKSDEESIKYLKFLTTEDDLLSVLEWWVTEYLGKLSEVTSEDVEEAVQRFESHLGKTVELLNGERILLNDDEIGDIIEGAKIKYQTDTIHGSNGILMDLSKEIGINDTTISHYLRQTNRKRIRKDILIKICDSLELRYPEDILVDRERLLAILLTAERGGKEREKPGQPWWEQPTSTLCIFDRNDVERAVNEALRLYKTKTEVANRMREAGLPQKTLNVGEFIKKRANRVEHIVALLKIIGWKYEDVRELSLEELEDDDAILVPMEGKGGKLKLRDQMKKRREEEGSNEKIEEYIARKFNEELQKRDTKAQVHPRVILNWLYTRDKRMPKGMYLLACRVFNVEPNLSLHSRQIRNVHRSVKEGSKKIDFRKPAVFNLNGEIIEIREEQDEFYVVTGGKRLKAKKRRQKIGSESWGLTIIDYETDEGVYTVVKEMGELWLPRATPWYISPNKNLIIVFKNTKILENIVETILNKLNPKKEGEAKKEEDVGRIGQTEEVETTLVKIIKMDESTLKRYMGADTIQLRQLLKLIALQSALTGEDIKKTIKTVEAEIKMIRAPRNLDYSEALETLQVNKLYINLGNVFGIALVGHAHADGHLHPTANRGAQFIYHNNDFENMVRVKKLLEWYTYPVKIHFEDDRSIFTIKKAGLIGYALRRFIPKAAGKKTIGNPSIYPSITDDYQKAIPLLQSLVSDEANVHPFNKRVTIVMAVDVNEEVGEKYVEESKKIAEEKLKKLEEEGKLTPNNMRPIHLSLKEVNPEMVKLAESKTCNILQSGSRTFNTLEIYPKARGIIRFSVSKAGRVTALHKIFLRKSEAEKCYKLGIFKGPKLRDFEARVIIKSGSVRLVDEKKGVCKLSKEQIEILQSEMGEKNRVYYYKIKDYKDIVEIIAKNKPKELVDEQERLIDRGVRTTLGCNFVYVSKDCRIISVSWNLIWAEVEDEDGREAEDN